MDMTNGPIFKSIMFALLVAYVALVSLGVWAAKGGKLTSEPRPGQFALVDAGGQLIGDATINKDTSEIAVAFLVNEIQYAAGVSPEGFYCNGSPIATCIATGASSSGGRFTRSTR